MNQVGLVPTGNQETCFQFHLGHLLIVWLRDTSPSFPSCNVKQTTKMIPEVLMVLVSPCMVHVSLLSNSCCLVT